MLTVRSDQTVEGGLARFDDVGPVPLGFEIEAEALGQMVLVFDDEDALSGRRHACVALGSSSVNVLPRPVPSLEGEGLPAVPPRDRPDDEEAETAAAARAGSRRGRHAVEAAEHALQLCRRNPDAVVEHANGQPLVVALFEQHADARFAAANT